MPFSPGTGLGTSGAVSPLFFGDIASEEELCSKRERVLEGKRMYDEAEADAVSSAEGLVIYNQRTLNAGHTEVINTTSETVRA
jgi:hypothetical protein